MENAPRHFINLYNEEYMRGNKEIMVLRNRGLDNLKFRKAYHDLMPL